jgi:uncharacterized damage-inducible protein DinB
MNISKQIAKNFREVYFGRNWTVSNLKEHLSDVTWQQAKTKAQDFNTIATLVFHIHYFVKVTLKVLEGKPLNGNDKLSFDHPPINSQKDWLQFLDSVWSEGEQFANLIENLPDTILLENFTDGKYGNYYRNLTGIIEHTHYHLGQILLIKKMVIPLDENPKR